MTSISEAFAIAMPSIKGTVTFAKVPVPLTFLEESGKNRPA